MSIGALNLDLFMLHQTSFYEIALHIVTNHDFVELMNAVINQEHSDLLTEFCTFANFLIINNNIQMYAQCKIFISDSFTDYTRSSFFFLECLNSH